MINTLVLSGCCYNILDMYGAIYHLVKEKYICYDNIKHIYGTSGGSIIGLAILLKMNEDDIFKYMHERPWDELTESSSFSINKKGVFNKDFFRIMIEPILKSKYLTIHTTLAELYIKTDIVFNIVTVKLDDMTPVLKNYKTDQDLTILDAIYMSSAIPYLFEPLKYNNTYYIDGGICCNFPIEYCIKDNIKSENILGIKTQADTNFSKANIDDLSLFTYFAYISRQFINKIYDITNRSDYTDYKIIRLRIKEQTTEEGIIICKDKAKRLKYLNNGIEIAKEFLKHSCEI
jgi:predicted acylesterase/phospholipase RssA